jgi:hypothetical protein
MNGVVQVGQLISLLQVSIYPLLTFKLFVVQGAQQFQQPSDEI